MIRITGTGPDFNTDEYEVLFEADPEHEAVELVLEVFGPHPNGSVPMDTPAYLLRATATRPQGQGGPWEGRLTYTLRKMFPGQVWAIRLRHDAQILRVDQIPPEPE